MRRVLALLCLALALCGCSEAVVVAPYSVEIDVTGLAPAEQQLLDSTRSYQLTQEGDGWRIGGVQLVKTTGMGG